MKFNLHYRGPLKSNAGPKEKQALRRYFHPQLEDLWTRLPLNESAEKCLDPKYVATAIKCVGGWDFASVENDANHLIAKLDITFLRPQEPGRLASKGGDIDNKIKTLLDALSIPQKNQIPNGDIQQDNEIPLHCLLEDDNIVNGLNITVDRLLNCEKRGQLDEAMALHKKEEALCEELGNKDGLQISYGNQALILKAWGQLDEAIALLKKQEVLCEELGMPKEQKAVQEELERIKTLGKEC